MTPRIRCCAPRRPRRAITGGAVHGGDPQTGTQATRHGCAEARREEGGCRGHVTDQQGGQQVWLAAVRSVADGSVAPRESDLRRAYRERLAEPFAREVALLAERPYFGPRERRDLDALFDRIDEKQKDLAARLATLTAGSQPGDVEAAVETSMNRLGESLLEQLEAAGLPLFTPDGASRLRFRATLVMPVPILRANTCVAGDTATWEFDEEDLFGRGFEMKALASAP